VLERLRGAELRRIDFTSSNANKRINDWVEKQTKGRIRDLVPAGVLTADTRLVLVNALYFRARWLKEFSERGTKPAPFHLSADQTVDVATMRARVHGRYTEDEHARVAEVPYLGGVAMVLVLPKQSLTAVEDSVGPERLDAWLGKSDGVELDLALPKFEVESRLSLAETLGALGLAELFDPRTADLSGFNGGREPLWLSAALHQAWVAVDEEGTEAAASTAIVALGAAEAVSQPVPFHVDRPFLFLIVDRKTEQVLFFGRVKDPR